VLARQITLVLLYVRCGCGDSGFGRVHIRALQSALRLQRLDLRRGCGDTRDELIYGGTIVIVDDLDQKLSGPYALEVLHGHGAHIARHFRGDRRQIRLQIRIVGRLQAGVRFPAVPAGGDEHQRAQGDCKYDGPPQPVGWCPPAQFQLFRHH
jgi:hypothetical protein